MSTVDIGLDHPLLNEGIVFVDSPGLSDANAVRSKNASKHHRKCTHKIVVTQIGRAEADGSVRKSLQTGYRIRGSGSTILVLTHGDDIDLETEVTGTPIEKKRVAKLGAEIKELRSLREKKNQERRKIRPEERDEIDEEISSITDDFNRKKTERDGVRLEMRNRKVVSTMQSIYKKLTQDPKPLPALAVGNNVYAQYQAGFSSDEKPYLSVQQTNIPALRHRLYSMPVEGRYNDALHFAEVQLPSLINSIELYCTQMHMARKEEISQIICKPKGEVRELVRAALYEHKELATEKILQPMKLEESRWSKSARARCLQWKTQYPGKLSLIRNQGHEKGRKGARDISWNGELADISTESLEELFRDYLKNSRSWAQKLSGKLEKLCNSTMDNLRRKYTAVLHFRSRIHLQCFR